MAHEGYVDDGGHQVVLVSAVALLDDYAGVEALVPAGSFRVFVVQSWGCVDAGHVSEFGEFGWVVVFFILVVPVVRFILLILVGGSLLVLVAVVVLWDGCIALGIRIWSHNPQHNKLLPKIQSIGLPRQPAQKPLAARKGTLAQHQTSENLLTVKENTFGKENERGRGKSLYRVLDVELRRLAYCTDAADLGRVVLWTQVILIACTISFYHCIKTARDEKSEGLSLVSLAVTIHIAV